MNKLNVGDTIKCSDKKEMVDLSCELAKEDIFTDFLYEKDGEKGLWLVVIATAYKVPDTEEIKQKICDFYCRFPSELNQEKLDAMCDECPLNNLE